MLKTKTLALSLLLLGGGADATVCDIYDAAGTPCVAAHAVTRALYAAYAGPLYQIQRDDGKLLDVGVVVPGGVADAAAQDAFCGSGTCTIERIYDQSPRGNHLATAPAGGAHKAPDSGVNAAAMKTTLSGRPVYAAVFEGGMGYRNDTTSGIATGDEPESIYAVVSGIHYNAGCCFDCKSVYMHAVSK